MLETLLGGLIGGLLRIAPEFLKFFDKKNERAHELAMLNKEMEFAKVKGEIAMHQADAQLDAKQLDAMMAALQGQAEMVKGAWKWVASLSALVRPLVTYLFVGFYFTVKAVGMSLAVQAGADWQQVLIKAWTIDDFAIFSMILSFYFVGRVWDRKR